jgi:hypothetical protein
MADAQIRQHDTAFDDVIYCRRTYVGNQQTGFVMWWHELDCSEA